MGRRERRAEKRRKQWGQIAIGILLVLLMVLSLVQFSGTGNGQRFVYKDHRFSLTEEGFSVEAADGRLLRLDSAPLEGSATNLTMQSLYGGVTPVTAEPDAVATIAKAAAFQLTFDASMPVAHLQPLEMARFELEQQASIAASGILEENDRYPGFPIINCSAGGPAAPVLNFRVNETQYGVTITQEGDCVIIISDPIGALVAKDYLLLVTNGVITDGSEA